MQNSNLFLKYRSKSEKNYYELTDLFNLKPLDVLVMQYLMKMFKKSTSHGKSGKNGKCFYRDDKKFTGFYYGGHYKDMAEHVHANVNVKSLKRSIDRLQSKGLLYHHKSYNHVQIFFPLFDSDVRTSFNDPNYKTVINFSEIDKGNPITSARDKMSFAQRTKWALRKVQNVLCRNVPVTNVPKTNVPNTNVVQNNKNKSTARKQLPKWINKNLNKSIAKSLIDNTKDVPKVATKIIDIIFKVNKRYMNIKGTDYYSCSSNPYIQDGSLLQTLGDIFVFHSDFEDTIDKEYSKYIEENSNLKLKNKASDNQSAGYQPDIIKIEDNLEYDYKHMKQCKANDDEQDYLKYKEAYNAENENAIDYCKNPSNKMTIEYVDYSKEAIHEQNSNKKPSKALTDKIKKQLRDMNKRDKMAE